MIATLTLKALRSNFLFSSGFNFHAKDIGDIHGKSSMFNDDGYKIYGYIPVAKKSTHNSFVTGTFF
ncbi:hypothetical protein CCR71_26790 [Salmonella enterica]|nr:hypothetical protein [Salmonella enterica]